MLLDRDIAIIWQDTLANVVLDNPCFNKMQAGHVWITIDHRPTGSGLRVKQESTRRIVIDILCLNKRRGGRG